MKMFARLRYLLAEGFEVASLSGYDKASKEGNASILYIVRDEEGAPHLQSETFSVTPGEMEQCSLLFLASLSGNGE